MDRELNHDNATWKSGALPVTSTRLPFAVTRGQARASQSGGSRFTARG